MHLEIEFKTGRRLICCCLNARRGSHKSWTSDPCKRHSPIRKPQQQDPTRESSSAPEGSLPCISNDGRRPAEMQQSSVLEASGRFCSEEPQQKGSYYIIRVASGRNHNTSQDSTGFVLNTSIMDPRIHIVVFQVLCVRSYSPQKHQKMNFRPICLRSTVHPFEPPYSVVPIPLKGFKKKS